MIFVVMNHNFEKKNMMLEVENCLLSLNNVEKVNKNAYYDEL